MACSTLVDFTRPELVWLSLHGLPPVGWGVGVALSTLAAIVGAFLFLSTKGSFPILALFALLVIPLVFASTTYVRASTAPRVEPAALLRTDGTPVIGSFVSETEDRILIGTFEEGQAEESRGSTAPTVPPQLLSLRADDVRNLTVGPPLLLRAKDLETPGPRDQPRTARQWAAGAVLLLCERAASAARRTSSASGRAASRARSSARACTSTELTAFREAGRREGQEITRAEDEASR